MHQRTIQVYNNRQGRACFKTGVNIYLFISCLLGFYRLDGYGEMWLERIAQNVGSAFLRAAMDWPSQHKKTVFSFVELYGQSCLGVYFCEEPSALAAMLSPAAQK